MALPKWYYAQAIITYAITGSAFVLNYLSAKNRAVTDATGATWQTINIYETAAIVSLFTMIFIAALTAVKLAQQQTSQIGAAGTADTSETPLTERVR
jgi:hypothetical protein